MNPAPPTVRDPQLGLFESRPGDPNVAWLEKMLDGAGHWMTARDIMESCGGRLHDRDVRELASASGWIISGQRGYRHMNHATLEECDRASDWLISQGKKMIERGILLRGNAHRQIG